MASLTVHLYNDSTSSEVNLSITGLDHDMTDAEALQFAEAIQGSDYAQRVVGTGGELFALGWSGLNRAVPMA